MKQRIFREKTDYIVLAVLLAVFGYFAFFCQVMEISDSFQYKVQMVSREPVYALLLKGLMGIFGEGYGFPLTLLQNLLAIISIYWLYVRLTNIFKLPIIFKGCGAVLLLIPHLITPLAAKTHLIITNSVMTEGITFSLYYIWMGMMVSLLLGYDEKKQNRTLIWSLVLAFVLTMTRGQFLICIAGWFLVAVFVSLRQKEYKKILFVFLGCLVVIIGKSYLTKAYHYVESGLFVETTSGKPMVLANILFLSDLEDGSDIENPRLKKAYENMVCQVQERELSVKNASGNIIDVALYHEFGHETINFDIIDPEVEAVVAEVDGVTSAEYEKMLVIIDAYTSEIIGDVLPNVLPEFIGNYFVIASLGFVRSIAIEHWIFPIYAVFMYIIAIGLALFLLKKNKNSKGAWFMALTLVLICGNVFGTSIMIQCISRYMIYNLPFFYIAGMAMLTEIGQLRKE